MISLILVLILFLIIIFGVIYIAFKQKKKTPQDYYTFFVMGLTWLPIGIALNNSFFYIMGFVFMIVGLVNKDKWKNGHKPWSKMTNNEKKIKKLLIGVVILLLFLGVALMIIVNNGWL